LQARKSHQSELVDSSGEEQVPIGDPREASISMPAESGSMSVNIPRATTVGKINVA
jgi:hypothetical protein